MIILKWFRSLINKNKKVFCSECIYYFCRYSYNTYEKHLCRHPSNEKIKKVPDSPIRRKYDSIIKMFGYAFIINKYNNCKLYKKKNE